MHVYPTCSLGVVYVSQRDTTSNEQKKYIVLLSAYSDQVIIAKATRCWLGCNVIGMQLHQADDGSVCIVFAMFKLLHQMFVLIFTAL